MGTAALMVKAGGEGTYLGLILVWVSPFLALIWSVSSKLHPKRCSDVESIS